MARKKLLDSNGREIRGLYYDELKNGRNIFARFNIPTAPAWVNLTKEYKVTTITEAKKQRNKLLELYNNPHAEYIKNKELVNDLIEAYISERPVNLRHPHRSQRKLVENRFKLYLEPYLEYVTVEKFSSKHLVKVKANLDNRGVGLQTYQKLRTLIKSSLKGTGVNFDMLFSDFEPLEKHTIANKKKFKIDEYFVEHLETVAQKFYTHFTEHLYKSTLQKEKDRYAFFLFLLLTASRVGEASRLKIKDVQLFDNDNNIYRVIVPKDVNKSRQTREVMIPNIITPFIAERITIKDKNSYLFESDIENVIPYHFKKSLKLFELRETKGLSVHIFRALFRNISIDRELNLRATNYLMDRQRRQSVDEKYYDAALTHQQRFNVYQHLSTYEKLCRGDLHKNEIDFSKL
jgi:integrase